MTLRATLAALLLTSVALPALAQDAPAPVEGPRPVEPMLDTNDFAEGEAPLWFPQTRFLGPATDAWTWILSVAVETEHGLAWRADPSDESAPFDISLYSGAPGVILFGMDLARITGRNEHLETAKRAADDLIHRLPDTLDKPGAAGLYTGAAGQAYVLFRLYESTGEERYLNASRTLFEKILATAGPREVDGEKIMWDGYTDIISGAAGIGLYLLYAQNDFADVRARETAIAAGRWLASVGVKTEDAGGGLKWPVAVDSDRFMPNFAHGTAGVVHFLSALVIFTADDTARAAAFAGGRHLEAIANKDNGGRLVRHHEPRDGENAEDLYYLSWCHGPAGSARAYYTLHQLNLDKPWLDAVHQAARSITSAGLPDARTPGYWDNYSACCGHAGILNFAIDMYGLTRDKSWMTLADRMGDDLVKHSIHDDKGRRWAHAEHRNKPEDIRAQVGMMQGAVGIGRALLRIEAIQRNCDCLVKLPDTPF